MECKIAVAGKGGSGKTSVAALVIRYLMRHGPGPVLAVDADPNANLGEALGLSPCVDLMDVLQEIQGTSPMAGGMDKTSYVDARVREALMEADGGPVDLIAMGRPDGPGCYCYANALLRAVMEKLENNYAFVVVDNEAGLEHLSRRTTDLVDLLLVVSDNSMRGVRSAGRVARLVAALGLRVKRQCLMICKVQGKLSPAMREEAAATGLEFAGVLPYDFRLAAGDAAGEPLLGLPDEAAAVRWLEPVLDELLQPNRNLRKKVTLPCRSSFTGNIRPSGSMK
ncbi:MAG: AAA family ATPase [Thermoanaerobacterales bacterium]|nr:AAA family ATPase [Thermoanaerobacterales bacterium]